MIGGGYVGLELSQAMRRFGSDVTVIDRNDRLAHHEDDDVTEGLHALFEDEGIEVFSMPGFNVYRESPATTYKLCSGTAAGKKR